nr:hypothetical protein [Oryctes rhinoceros nudivirus]
MNNNRQQAFDPKFAFTTTPIPLFSSGASPSNLDGQFCNAQTCGMLLSVNACKFKMFAVFIITLVFIVILVCIIVLYSNHRRYKYVRSERDEPPPSHNGEENSDAGSVYSDVLARLPQFRKFYNNYDKPTTSNDDDDDAYIVEPVVPRIHKNVNLLPFDSIDRDDDYYAELEQDDAKMGHKTGNIADSVASGSINGDENDNDDEDVEMSDDEPLSNKSNTTTTTTTTTTNTSVDKRVAGRSSISNPQTTTTISNATTSDNTTTQTSTNKPGIYPSLDKVTA